MSERRIWDLSQTLQPELPVWPGDVRFACVVTAAVVSGVAFRMSRRWTIRRHNTQACRPSSNRVEDVLSISTFPSALKREEKADSAK